MTRPPKVTKDFVLDKCDFFAQIGIWPITKELNPKGWLENFFPDEQEYAIHLLNSFMLFRPPILETMFYGSLQALSIEVTRQYSSKSLRQEAWADFLKNCTIVPVQTDSVSAVNSSNYYTLLARRFLSDSTKIYKPEVAIAQALSGKRQFVFVDDFLGTGKQFSSMWKHKFVVGGHTAISFSETTDSNFYYCPVVATSLGIGNLLKGCANVKVVPSHILPERYSVFHPESVVWPEELISGANDFLESASLRAGLPSKPENEYYWKGFEGQGLTLAFDHSIPDATLPIFYWEQSGWKPLLKKP